MLKTKVMLTSFALGISLCVLPGQSFASTYYTVKPGDSLWKISRSYNVAVGTIQALNGLKSATIYPGQKLLVSDGAAGNVNSQVSRGSGRTDIILNYAKSLVGVPYVSGGISPRGFDCSGYVKYVFGHFGITLPRIAADQYRKGYAVSAGNAKPGDFVAFKSGNYISHIGIYLGNGKFISATSSRGVAIDSVYGSYWGRRLLGFSRVLP